MKRSKTDLLVSLLVVLSVAISPVTASVGQFHAASMHPAMTGHADGLADTMPGIEHHGAIGHASVTCDRPCCDESDCMQQLARNCAFHHLPMFPAQAQPTPPEPAKQVCPETLTVSVHECGLAPDTPPPRSL